MQNYDVISKGVYNRSPVNGFVGVTSFLFIREQGKKYLVLKLKNSRGEAVEEVNLKVTLLDRKGRTLSVLHPSSDKGGAANSSFAFGEKIEVVEECCDFTAKVESAVYGGYLYREGKDGVEIDCAESRGDSFDLNSVSAAMRGKTRTVAERRLGIPVLVTILTCLLLLCTALVTYFQLKDFIEDATGFSHYGVLYEFADGDKSDGSDIIVTGYRGSGPNVVIPRKIDGHTVTVIQSGAFAGNKKIKRLKIEGAVKIEEYAFAGCENLVSVKMKDVAEVGEYAFYGCKALTSLNIDGKGEIALKSYAFKDCTRLAKVNIKQRVSYPADLAIFSGDKAVKELYLENFGSGVMTSLFDGINTSLKKLSITYLDGISDNFCNGFSDLEKVSIAYIEGDGFGIGSYAFRFTSLKELKIPAGLNSVGGHAFEGTSINSFNSYGVESIGEYAFQDCRFLTEFTVPEGLTVLEEGIFTDCTSLEKVVFESDENLESIGEFAFLRCESLKEIVIPDSVEFIGYEIFYGCNNLTSLTLPFMGESVDNPKQLAYFINYSGGSSLASVTLTRADALADYAFEECESLKEVNLNEGIRSIGDFAFYTCTGLKSIVIPASVNATGYQIFSNCYRLYEIYNLSSVQIRCDYSLAVYGYSEQSMPKATEDGYTVALSDGAFAYPAGWYLIDFPDGQDLVLPQSFEGVSLYTVTDYLFYRESGVTSVSLPVTVSGIGSCAFYGCDSLVKVSVPLTAGISEIGSEAFENCTALESIEFCENLQKIGGAAFGGCAALKRINIDNLNAVDVASYAFVGCTSLTEASIGGVTAVGEGAFYGCAALESAGISYLQGEIGAGAFYGCLSLKEIAVPQGTTYIAPSAFEYCKNLRKVTLPSTLGEIGDLAFKGCERLRAVVNYSPLDISVNDENGGVGKTAIFIVKNFSDAQQLGYTELGGVTFLHLWQNWVAVWCDDGITTINITKKSLAGYKYSTLKIADYAFADNSALTGATLDAVTQIGEYAFYGCAYLKQVNLLNSYVTKIEEGAFENCPSLQNVTLPEGLLEIGDYAFEFADIINLKLPSTVEAIGKGAFHANYSMQTAELSKSLTTLGESAFSGCLALTSINLQDTKIRSLGEAAFLSCSSLSYLSLPETLNEIPALAFCYCRSLSDAVIPRSVNYIGDQAFYGCTSLLQVHNLSRLAIRAGSALNGYCSYYALYVFNNTDEVMKFATADGYNFAGYAGNWYFYDYTNYDAYKKLPESFTYEKTKITSYIIREGTFGSVNIIIPMSVSFIEDGAITNPRAIYYCGNYEEWLNLRPANLTGANVYYYSECIHTDGVYWRYAGGSPTTSQTQLSWKVTKNATCTEDGLSTGKCPVCGKTETEVIEKLYHSYSDNGKCTRCGLQGEFATSLSGTYESYGITVSDFYVSDVRYISTNDRGSYAKITVTAKKDMQVLVACNTTSSYYDLMTVTAAGVTIAEFASYSTQTYSVQLSAGQSLVLNYYKGGTALETAEVSYILIYA